MKLIKMIAGVSANGVIGVNNTIPWKHKADMKRFKELTTNHTVVMGRNTFESFGERPLPNRQNIVITRNSQCYHPDVWCAGSIKDAIEMSDGLIWLIGGERIYREGMDFAQELDITIVPETIDTSLGNPIYFPWINPNIFKLHSTQYDQDNKLTHVIYKH